MARIKPIEVQKFGGTDQLGVVKVNGYKHDVASIEEQSTTSLQSDIGVGQVAVIRCFTFKANPEAFNANPPSKQELFNYHSKGIEMALWRDGLTVMPSVEPRLVFDDDKGTYSFFIGALPAKGHILQDTPLTLHELANGRLSN